MPSCIYYYFFAIYYPACYSLGLLDQLNSACY